MAGAVFVWVDQARMTPAMAHDFRAMASAFKRDTRCTLHARSGIRLESEQLAIWYQRMVRSSQVNGRRVYEWRWWQGVLWARISSAGSVAQPRTSNHELDVSAGRRGAADVYDSGSDAGVTRFGTSRHLWMVVHGPEYGFSSDEGIRVNEAWHKRYTRDPHRSIPSAPAKPKPKPTPKPTPIQEEDDDMPKNTARTYLAPTGAHRSKQREYALIFNTGSGYEHEESTGLGGTFSTADRQAMANNFDTSNWRETSEDVALEIKRGLAAVRGGLAQLPPRGPRKQ